jgi:hypothetical protein
VPRARCGRARAQQLPASPRGTARAQRGRHRARSAVATSLTVRLDRLAVLMLTRALVCGRGGHPGVRDAAYDLADPRVRVLTMRDGRLLAEPRQIGGLPGNVLTRQGLIGVCHGLGRRILYVAVGHELGTLAAARAGEAGRRRRARRVGRADAGVADGGRRLRARAPPPRPPRLPVPPRRPGAQPDSC